MKYTRGSYELSQNNCTISTFGNSYARWTSVSLSTNLCVVHTDLPRNIRNPTVQLDLILHVPAPGVVFLFSPIDYVSTCQLRLRHRKPWKIRPAREYVRIRCAPINIERGAWNGKQNTEDLFSHELQDKVDTELNTINPLLCSYCPHPQGQEPRTRISS